MRHLKRLVLLYFVITGSAQSYQTVSVGMGGGYAGNLFADSFAIGNSYLLSNLSVSSVNFSKVKLKLYYDISYYNYDTGDLINNVFHVPGFVVYRRDPGSRLKWGIEAAAAIKDYVNPQSTFDNNRIFLVADASYYVTSGLQAKAMYRLVKSKYHHYSDLDFYEHLAGGDIVSTFPTKTTARASVKYSVRRFDRDQVTYHWIDTEFGLSQSIDIRTGASLTVLRRWTGGGERPLSSYYIISGITSYWDPWKGNQFNAAIKRILPYAVLSRLEGGYWKRNFSYDDIMRSQLWWLRNKAGRHDEGWLVRGELSRQFNLRIPALQSFMLSVRGGYTRNGSDDPFYKYQYYFGDVSLNIHVL